MDCGGQLLEVRDHAAAARVEGDRDVCSVCRLQAPTHHIHKLEHKSKGWKHVPSASLVMGELCAVEKTMGWPSCSGGFLYMPLPELAQNSHPALPPTALRGLGVLRQR